MGRLLGAFDRGDVFPLSCETTVRQWVTRHRMPLTAVSIESFERDRNALLSGATHFALEHCAEEGRNDVPDNFADESLPVSCSVALENSRRRIVDVAESPVCIVNYEWISDTRDDASAEFVGGFCFARSLDQFFVRYLQLFLQRLGFFELPLELHR